MHRAGCRAPTRAWKAAGWIAQCAKPACQLRELFPLSPPPQVVPFSPSSGLLEWVEHTQPMADYLLGPSRAGGAHMRYKRRGDYTWVQCYTDVRGGGGVGGLGAFGRGGTDMTEQMLDQMRAGRVGPAAAQGSAGAPWRCPGRA